VSAAPAYYRRVNFDPWWLFLSLIPSGIGFVLFVYGKKQQRLPHLIAGIVFTIYPFFTPSIVVMIIVGVAVGAGLWIAVRGGW
jgi:branched-subunit amino acid transport protein